MTRRARERIIGIFEARRESAIREIEGAARELDAARVVTESARTKAR
jgi:hypothetical protein